MKIGDMVKITSLSATHAELVFDSGAHAYHELCHGILVRMGRDGPDRLFTCIVSRYQRVLVSRFRSS